MTSAEENILRAVINPWPLSLSTIARQAGRSQDTTRKHLRTLERHQMIKRLDVYHSMSSSRGVAAFMATEVGHGAIMSIDDMRSKD